MDVKSAPVPRHHHFFQWSQEVVMVAGVAIMPVLSNTDF